MSAPSEDVNVSFTPDKELETIRFWKENEVYEKSLDLRKDAPTFVFYEGPPTANGLPHPGHCLTRAIKDLYPRYKTMQGFRVDRKAGWDTHGLPVEVEVCKELGIHAKEEIENFGVEPFIHKCLESVFRYTKQWEELTERLGFWIHLNEAYVTYHQSYVESVWWSLKTLFEKGLLYQGHKIVWWWAQGGTALSSGEVGQGYREVADPSVFVRFPLLDATGQKTDADLLVWTTTPWTLPSNQFVAVHPDLDYVTVELVDEKGVKDDRKVIMAAALVDVIAAKVKKQATVVASHKGLELVGRRYLPPFDCYYKTLGGVKGLLKSGKQEHVAWRVAAAEFVTTDSGSGIVHEAPAFGEVDFDLLQEQRERFEPSTAPELICAVAPDGKFTSEFPEYQGRWVKDCDKELVRNLKEKGVLFYQEQYLHDYPFCWRADQDPLIQYPRRSWFIRTQRSVVRMLGNNSRIGWVPEHIKDGRFGNFLASNIDWALSRERYWGTPLPIWVCEATGYMEAVGNYEELLKKPGVTGQEVWENAKKANPALCDDLKVHKPYIDAITYLSPKSQGARMRRVPEVIDCWYDSGAMPFAQWGYPFKEGSRERFADQFPADFISEALDQTRGWFYSLLAISTLLFGPEDMGESTKNIDAEMLAIEPTPAITYPHPFKNCMVLGLMLGEDGLKMSKKLRNYREPNEIFKKFGADALRWYFYANQTPWTSIRYSEQAIKDSMPEFLLRLRNVWGFFKIYADIDGFDPAAAISHESLKLDNGNLSPVSLSTAKGYRPVSKRAELDRWIISEMHNTSVAVANALDTYDHYNACAKISQLVDALSNWYVRRSRDRFWSGGDFDSKADAYWTLYELLVTITKLIAPFVPFLAEEMWQHLAVGCFSEKGAEKCAGKGAACNEGRENETGKSGNEKSGSVKSENGKNNSGNDDNCGRVCQRMISPGGVMLSVHLCDYPVGDVALVDETLSRQMALAREIVSLGRNARMGAKLKVRQPLQSVEIVLVDPTQKAAIEKQVELIKQELNVKKVELIEKADKYITYTVMPDFKKLGPKLGKQLPEVKKALAEADGSTLLAGLEKSGKVSLTVPSGMVELTSDDIQIRLQAKEGWAAAHSPLCVVILATELTEELLAEGRARELVRLIQDQRKEIGCEYTDRIRVSIVTDSAALNDAMVKFADYIKGETLAAELTNKAIANVTPVTLRADSDELQLYVTR